jgi:NADH:ubiquinone oxidoreductase subunit K
MLCCVVLCCVVLCCVVLCCVVSCRVVLCCVVLCCVVLCCVVLNVVDFSFVAPETHSYFAIFVFSFFDIEWFYTPSYRCKVQQCKCRGTPD